LIENLLVDHIEEISADHRPTPERELRLGSPPTSNDPRLLASIAPLLAAKFSGPVEIGQASVNCIR
jgi:hypothetical protein